MSRIEIIEKKPLSLSELKAEIALVSKRDGELSFRAGKTQDYVNSFSSLSKTACAELKKKLEDLNVPRLKDEHIVKIVDLLPVSVEDLSLVLQGYALTVSKENMANIVKAVKDYRK